MGEIKGGIWNIMERLDWKHCKNIDYVADTNKDYDYIIELVDMPFEKDQDIEFKTQDGRWLWCVVLKVRGMKIYLLVKEEI